MAAQVKDSAAAVARVQRVLDNYEVISELGRGAMGVVYLGRHKSLGRPVAIKELLGQVSDDLVRRRFRTEAEVLAKLKHPHVVEVHDFVANDDALLIVMEQLPGGTVWERFTTAGFTPPQAVAVVMATCAGLHHAHQREVVHRDIKPDNLMFAEDGSLKITDFGIAKVVSGQQTLATVDGGVLGTPAYMAPEQAMAGDIGPPADVYAAGVMLYELLSGRLPFPETDNPMAMLFQRVNEEPEPLGRHAGHVPEIVGDVAMKAIAREPAARWRTPEEFGVHLGEAAATAWGVEWLKASGLTVRGSDRLAEAARTTRAGSESVIDLSQPAAKPADVGRASATVIDSPVGGAAPTGPAPTVVPEREQPNEPAATRIPDAAVPPVAPTAPVPPPQATVVPIATSHASGGVDLAVLDPEDVVDVDEAIQKPSFPFVQILAALAAVAAVAYIALNPLGDAPREVTELASAVSINDESIDTDENIKLDLGETVVIEVDPAQVPNASEAELGFSVVGVPVGSITEDVIGGRAVIEPGPFEFIVAGGLTGTVTVRDQAGDDIGASDFQIWIGDGWLTAFALVGVLLALAVFAYFESNARPLRKGRRKIGRLIGLALTGAVGGITAVVAASVVREIEPTIPTLVATAILGAIAFVSMGLVLVRMGRRRRMRRFA